jgi:hypothetical protein
MATTKITAANITAGTITTTEIASGTITSSNLGTISNVSVNWQAVKTSNFTAVAGQGYFINTTSGAVTVTLPASPTIGDTIKIKDYSGTFATNNVILNLNSIKLDGFSTASSLSTNHMTITLTYIDATQGWRTFEAEAKTNLGLTPLYVAATGGTVLTNGSYKTHIFTGCTTFVVSCAGNSAGSFKVDYLVVAGGGGGASSVGGGGGAGGFRLSNSIGSPNISPLATPTGITVTATTYPVTVGAGGAGGGNDGLAGAKGSDSVFSTITSTGGGYGQHSNNGGPGGSGGGGGYGSGTGGCGNAPPVSPSQGNPGGSWSSPGGGFSSSGGGGAAAAGTTNVGPTSTGGNGGIGSYISNCVFGPTAPSYGTPGPVSSTRYFAGGGSSYGTGASGTAGAGGGGTAATAGTAHTGGGAGGGNYAGGAGRGGAGGKGIVVIRYQYQA